MAAKKVGRPTIDKVPFSKTRFKEALKAKGVTLIKIANTISYSEKTIRRAESKGEINPAILEQLAISLDVDPLFLQGVYDERANKIDLTPEERQSLIRPELFPYYKYKARILDKDIFIEDVLLHEGINPDEYAKLSQKEQTAFLVELNIALMRTVHNHFPNKDILSSNDTIPMPPEDEIIQI